MVNANLFRLFWLSSVGLCLTFLLGDALAAQVCKYYSIPATAPASRFADNDNGTVTDQATGLQWKRCSEGQTWTSETCTGDTYTFTWSEAMQYADKVSYAGKDDWRLPNVNELASVIEQACKYPSIDLGVFPATPAGDFWSSSSNTDDYKYGNKQYVSFFINDGRSHNSGYTEFERYVRLVRGGQ